MTAELFEFLVIISGLLIILSIAAFIGNLLEKRDEKLDEYNQTVDRR